jgi:hypothetical protein
MSDFIRMAHQVLAKLEDNRRINVCNCSRAERRIRESLSPELFANYHDREFCIAVSMAERKWWRI